MHPGRERPVTVSFGWRHAAIATYADGRTVATDASVSATFDLVRLVGFVDVAPRRVSFAAWQEIGEDDETYRQRSLSCIEYNLFDEEGHRIPGRWQVRLDWGRAHVLFKHEPVGTCLVEPIGNACVHIEPFVGQPKHTIETIERLAKLVAGEPIGEPFSDDEEEAWSIA